MIVTCRREHLEERCLQRGYSFSSVLGCIVSDSGDVISVDTGHADYPVERVGSLSFTCVPDCNYPEFACGVGECCEESPFGGTNGCVACESSSSSVASSSSSSSSCEVCGSGCPCPAGQTCHYGKCRSPNEYGTCCPIGPLADPELPDGASFESCMDYFNGNLGYAKFVDFGQPC